jgi:hypothetical protein
VRRTTARIGRVKRSAEARASQSEPNARALLWTLATTDPGTLAAPWETEAATVRVFESWRPPTIKASDLIRLCGDVGEQSPGLRHPGMGRGGTWASQVPGSSSCCVPWSYTTPGAASPRPAAERAIAFEVINALQAAPCRCRPAAACDTLVWERVRLAAAAAVEAGLGAILDAVEAARRLTLPEVANLADAIGVRVASLPVRARAAHGCAAVDTLHARALITVIIGAAGRRIRKQRIRSWVNSPRFQTLDAAYFRHSHHDQVALASTSILFA